jgi:hypothetical protein
MIELSIVEITHLLTLLRKSDGYNDGDRIPNILVNKLELQKEMDEFFYLSQKGGN